MIILRDFILKGYTLFGQNPNRASSVDISAQNYQAPVSGLTSIISSYIRKFWYDQIHLLAQQGIPRCQIVVTPDLNICSTPVEGVSLPITGTAVHVSQHSHTLSCDNHVLLASVLN